MDKLYYQEYYYLERNHWWFKVREEILKDQLIANITPLKKESVKILNIGAATGKTSEMLNNFGEVTSIEFDPDCCDFVNNKLGIQVINASILDLPFQENTFDIVCAFDVIEHIDDDLKAVKEMKRVCKKGGYIYLTVPAFMQLWSHHDIVNRHFRRYILRQVISLFNDQNGQIIYKTYFNSLLFLPVLIFRIISRLIPETWIRKGAGSDFSISKTDSFSNKIFYKIFSFERKLLSKIRFTFGVSILFLWKKN